MNPSTDVGKRDLPSGLRNRFTEFFVDELTENTDLLMLANSYLEAKSLPDNKIERLVKFYLKVRKEAQLNLVDGLSHKPHFSLRSFCRALYIAAKNPCGHITRSLYEAFCLSFLTQLDLHSYNVVEKMITDHIVGSAQEFKSIMKHNIPKPYGSYGDYIQLEGYWVPLGTLESTVSDSYILTKSVKKNLKDLVRIVSIGQLPVLLQGDTSVGKTSLIIYLANASGHKCVRINNHEHTDLQEYVGSYVADVNGKLVFREGLLVEAMRKGHWIILDELNLAPSDVLEALNRVLDDNREIFIPETQEVVKAHPHFMLFATQNPPGSYGGRKVLSRAFRNRFIELHFNEIPSDELEIILQQRCQMAPSYAKKMILIMKDLQTRRRGSAAFSGKYGFITLRDLFRWGERYRLAETKATLYDWDQHIADEGYLLLAGKVRKAAERVEIATVIQKYMKREVDPHLLFTLSDKTSAVTRSILERIERNKTRHPNIVWTFSMRQLAVLLSKALQFHEPALLVGETGGGKTTVCDLLAQNNNQRLVTVNCHMHTESGDFIGGLRPVRDHTGEDVNKLFEWVNGPLIEAMVDGSIFLADEISLADDKPERTLLLAEKGIDINNVENSELMVAHSNFHFIGTMNPGGDFGKKELSPALRNRFTEIWCESCNNRDDLVDIINHNIKLDLKRCNVDIGILIMDFIEWFRNEEIGKRFTISIRDILTWVDFINMSSNTIKLGEMYMNGACLTFLDSFGSGVTSSESDHTLANFKAKSLEFIVEQLRKYNLSVSLLFESSRRIEKRDQLFGINPFYIKVGSGGSEDISFTFDVPTIKHNTLKLLRALQLKISFTFDVPTIKHNTLKLLRALQLKKAILLEGSPGVGKTSLVVALAKSTSNKIYRVNLSDQTDISDLFGADLPVEGGESGQFSWRDGPLLQALKKGYWILLDELNLASQSVLEGLNACLDHRGEIFIPELGKTFHVKPGTKFFACQNPLIQGGSRRGLPKSFLNRFTQVYISGLSDEDYLYILKNQFPQLPTNVLTKMVEFNEKLTKALANNTFGSRGGPWECNLRDLTRWCEVTLYHYSNLFENIDYSPESTVKLIYANRLRTVEDRRQLETLFEATFGRKFAAESTTVYVTKSDVYFGDVCLKREITECDMNLHKQETTCLILRSQLKDLRSLTYCVNMNWMSILVSICLLKEVVTMISRNYEILKLPKSYGFIKHDINRLDTYE
ncbi:Midasin AAA lid domain [Popillia japonica]